MSVPHLCPKCDGERSVPCRTPMSGAGDRTCPTCGGSGVLWEIVIDDCPTMVVNPFPLPSEATPPHEPGPVSPFNPPNAFPSTWP